MYIGAPIKPPYRRPGLELIQAMNSAQGYGGSYSTVTGFSPHPCFNKYRLQLVYLVVGLEEEDALVGRHLAQVQPGNRRRRPLPPEPRQYRSEAEHGRRRQEEPLVPHELRKGERGGGGRISGIAAAAAYCLNASKEGIRVT